MPCHGRCLQNVFSIHFFMEILANRQWSQLGGVLLILMPPNQIFPYFLWSKLKEGIYRKWHEQFNTISLNNFLISICWFTISNNKNNWQNGGVYCNFIIFTCAIKLITKKFNYVVTLKFYFNASNSNTYIFNNEIIWALKPK